jgi:hypothetical protein
VLVEGAVQLCHVRGCGGTGWLPFFGRCILNAYTGGGQSFCGINDSVSGRYLRDWDGMMFELESVGDPLTACVGHENLIARMVICGMQ